METGAGLVKLAELIMPESDLCRLITNAQTPKAEPFEDWLYEAVLPTVRKTGALYLRHG